MTWLTLLKMALSLTTVLLTYVRDRRLIAAGEANAALAGIQEADHAIKRARAARRGVSHSADSVRDDPYNRDG